MAGTRLWIQTTLVIQVLILVGIAWGWGLCGRHSPIADDYSGAHFICAPWVQLGRILWNRQEKQGNQQRRRRRKQQQKQEERQRILTAPSTFDFLAEEEEEEDSGNRGSSSKLPLLRRLPIIVSSEQEGRYWDSKLKRGDDGNDEDDDDDDDDDDDNDDSPWSLFFAVKVDRSSCERVCRGAAAAAAEAAAAYSRVGPSATDENMSFLGDQDIPTAKGEAVYICPRGLSKKEVRDSRSGMIVTPSSLVVYPAEHDNIIPLEVSTFLRVDRSSSPFHTLHLTLQVEENSKSGRIDDEWQSYSRAIQTWFHHQGEKANSWLSWPCWASPSSLSSIPAITTTLAFGDAGLSFLSASTKSDSVRSSHASLDTVVSIGMPTVTEHVRRMSSSTVLDETRNHRGRDHAFWRRASSSSSSSSSSQHLEIMVYLPADPTTTPRFVSDDRSNVQSEDKTRDHEADEFTAPSPISSNAITVGHDRLLVVLDRAFSSQDDDNENTNREVLLERMVHRSLSSYVIPFVEKRVFGFDDSSSISPTPSSLGMPTLYSTLWYHRALLVAFRHACHDVRRLRTYLMLRTPSSLWDTTMADNVAAHWWNAVDHIVEGRREADLAETLGGQDNDDDDDDGHHHSRYHHHRRALHHFQQASQEILSVERQAEYLIPPRDFPPEQAMAIFAPLLLPLLLPLLVGWVREYKRYSSHRQEAACRSKNEGDRKGDIAN